MDSCRSCGFELTTPFLSLGSSPVSNAFLSTEQLGQMEPTYPLDVYLCSRCFLVQIDEFERAERIFGDEYPYFASFSESWLAHCRAFTTTAVERFGLDRSSFVVEVASNDGYLLQYFKELDIPILGIEPARSVAEVAINKGIPTEMAFFGTSYAESMKARGQLADLLIGNNVLAHVPNINDFVAGLAIALAPNGVVTLEFPHLMRLIEGNQFDTIYHEHFSYLSLHTVEALFSRHGLTVFDVEEQRTHGGSLRISAQRAPSGVHPTSGRVATLRTVEHEAGLLSLATYGRFGAQVAETKRKLLSFLIEATRAGKRIVGYGAPAKGNTLLNYCGIRTDFIEYTVDRNPHKQGRFLPGTRIPIHQPERIFEDRPDYVLILPWNIEDEIISQMGAIRDWGGRFVVAIPELRVIE